MTDYREQLRSAVRAAKVTRSTSYTWFGRRTQAIPLAVARQLPADTARAWLAADLHRKLYRGFYCHGTALPREPRVQSSPNDGKTPFVEALSAANTGKGAWQSGWSLRESDGEFVVAEKNGLSLRVAPEHTNPDPPDTDGATARVWMPKELLRASPGFYVALGDADLSADSSDMWRFYWRLSPDGAIAFMRAATSLLNAAGCPFRLKAVASRDNFSRNDSVVLYLPATESDIVFELLPRLIRSCEADLLPGAPALTLPLAQGLNWAEDPGTGESFGWHRCGLIADGIVRAFERGERSLEGRLAIVEDCFREAGISPEQPYLRSASSERPAFPDLTPRGTDSAPPDAPFTPRGTADPFLDTARGIGERICAEAIWHRNRCTWIGAEAADIRDPDAAEPDVVQRTLGPDLYDGVAGVALFLADLYAATGDVGARATATGAIRQALRRIGDIPPADALGLYTGRLGVAWAAARVASAIGAPELAARGQAAARRIIRAHDAVAAHDVTAGRAGGVLASLSLASMNGDPTLVAVAARLGDELLAAADKDEGGWSWPSPAAPGRRNLTGLAHGAAGIAVALLELFRVTGDDRYRDGAERAIAYERSWFDAGAGNWPDLRRQTARNGRGATFLTAWCHGAAGIALSRAYAAAVLGDDGTHREAEVALATTRAAIDKALASGAGDLSLCHGLAGNAAILLESAQRLAAVDAGAAAALAEVVGEYGIRRYGGPDGRWPSGSGAGEAPGLMLGRAGVGHFYLRLHDMFLAPVLLPVTAGVGARELKIAC